MNMESKTLLEVLIDSTRPLDDISGICADCCADTKAVTAPKTISKVLAIYCSSNPLHEAVKYHYLSQNDEYYIPHLSLILKELSEINHYAARSLEFIVPILKEHEEKKGAVSCELYSLSLRILKSFVLLEEVMIPIINKFISLYKKQVPGTFKVDSSIINIGESVCSVTGDDTKKRVVLQFIRSITPTTVTQ